MWKMKLSKHVMTHQKIKGLRIPTFVLFVVLILSGKLKGQNVLLIPDTLSGTTINLTLQNGIYQFYEGQNTTTMGANGNILGPTLFLKRGDFVNFSVNNQLADTTTIHWHGLHVAPENDGGPHTPIAPNTTWNPSFTILDKAATYWYHPHLHRFTNKHVSKGIAGMIIVRDEEESSLALPRKYGVDDFPLVIQTKDFDSNNEIVVPSNADDIIMVNATVRPFLEVPSQVVRYRILNGSSQRIFNIGLSNNQSFNQIASDGGLLNAPNPTTRLMLSPGERAEILINFSGMNGQTVYLKSFASELSNGLYGATNPGTGSGMTLDGYNPNALNGTDFNILQFNIVNETLEAITTIPTTLANATPIEENPSNVTRTLTFSPISPGMNQLNGEFLINNRSFNESIIDYNIKINNTEIWELTNQSAIAHPFHIHDVQFYILTRNGNTPPINERGRKDVVLVKSQETVRFIAKFEDFSNTTVPYMYHCHMLPHEDGGMMGQFVVGDSPLSLEEYLNADDLINIYPNPAIDYVNIKIKGNPTIKYIQIYDQLSRVVRGVKISSIKNGIKITGLPSGIFFLKMKIDNKEVTKKILVE